MITPYQVEELFEPNFSEPEYHDNYIIIDNYFKNYDRIHKMLTRAYVNSWKDGEQKRNFNDYYACKYPIFDYHPDTIKRDKRKRYIKEIMQKKWRSISDIHLYDKAYTGNFFKLIKPNSEGHQHVIHTDTVGYNIIIYIDKESSGGTALYDKIGKRYDDDEYSILNPVEEDNLPIDIIQAKPNRCAIFHGQKIPHGAWIEDHKVYEKNWRMNCITAVRATKIKGEIP